MKRTIAIFFLFTFLSANTAFGEVWKLPVLVRHYWEHSKKENNICFFEFLRIHYSDRSNHPAGSTHHHEKLPFKSAILHSFDGSSRLSLVTLLSGISTTLIPFFVESGVRVTL